MHLNPMAYGPTLPDQPILFSYGPAWCVRVRTCVRTYVRAYVRVCVLACVHNISTVLPMT